MTDRNPVVVTNNSGGGNSMGTILGVVVLVILIAIVVWFAMGNRLNTGSGTGTTNQAVPSLNGPVSTPAPAAS